MTVGTNILTVDNKLNQGITSWCKIKSWISFGFGVVCILVVLFLLIFGRNIKDPYAKESGGGEVEGIIKKKRFDRLVTIRDSDGRYIRTNRYEKISVCLAKENAVATSTTENAQTTASEEEDSEEEDSEEEDSEEEDSKQEDSKQEDSKQEDSKQEDHEPAHKKPQLESCKVVATYTGSNTTTL